VDFPPRALIDVNVRAADLLFQEARTAVDSVVDCSEVKGPETRHFLPSDCSFCPQLQSFLLLSFFHPTLDMRGGIREFKLARIMLPIAQRVFCSLHFSRRSYQSHLGLVVFFDLYSPLLIFSRQVTLEALEHAHAYALTLSIIRLSIAQATWVDAPGPEAITLLIVSHFLAGEILNSRDFSTTTAPSWPLSISYSTPLLTLPIGAYDAAPSCPA
jgi:hypothetical protein